MIPVPLETSSSTWALMHENLFRIFGKMLFNGTTTVQMQGLILRLLVTVSSKSIFLLAVSCGLLRDRGIDMEQSVWVGFGSHLSNLFSCITKGNNSWNAVLSSICWIPKVSPHLANFSFNIMLVYFGVNYYKLPSRWSVQWNIPFFFSSNVTAFSIETVQSWMTSRWS